MIVIFFAIFFVCQYFCAVIPSLAGAYSSLERYIFIYSISYRLLLIDIDPIDNIDYLIDIID